ncbi:MAG: discoidin domain-containing protein [Bacillota bacterium]|nr:discoidin domain-containing protein [Bacillota bacterium]
MKKIVSIILALTMTACLFCTVCASGSVIPWNSSWKIGASSTRQGMPILNAFDNNLSTYWHTNYTVENGNVTGHDNVPHTIFVDFGVATAVSGFRYTPRTDNSAGTIKAYNIYGSTNGDDFVKIYSGTFEYGTEVAKRTAVEASWTQVNIKAIKIEATETDGGYCTAVEINFLTGGTGSSQAASGAAATTTAPASATLAGVSAASNKVLGKNQWTVETSSDAGSTIKQAFDNDDSTYWHSAYKYENGAIVSKDNPPFKITIILPAKTNISGFIYTPRPIDVSTAGIVKAYNLYAAADSKSSVTLINSGTMAGTKDIQTVNFGYNINVQKLVFEVTDGVSGFGSMAEFDLINAVSGNSQKVLESNYTPTAEEKNQIILTNKSAWKVDVNSQIASISRAFDNDITTYWHSFYTSEGSTITGQDTPPFYVTMVLPEAAKVSGFSYTPRNGNAAGRILGYKLYVASTDEDDFTLIEEGEFGNDTSVKNIFFPCNIVVKKAKLEVVTSVSNYGVASEFDFLNCDSSKKDVNVKDYVDYKEQARIYLIDKSQISASSDQAAWAGHTISMAVDGNNESFWQTETGVAPPFKISLDLNNVYKITAFSYYPRQSEDLHGVWLTYNVWASVDGKNYDLVLENGKMKKTADEKLVYLPKETQARYIEFEIIEGYTSRASCAEINLYQSKSAYDEYKLKNNEKYVMQIGSKNITVTKGNNKAYTKTIDVAPYIDGGYTMIPLRGLLEEMGAEITWTDDTQTIYLKKGPIDTTLQIWYNLAFVNDIKYGLVRYTLEVPPKIKDSRTFIPLRFVSEQLGYSVSWDGATQTITITKEIKG